MMQVRNHIADFGETLDFLFLQEDGYCYPQILLNGAEGTSATLHGQHMTPDEIEKLGQALVSFAANLRNEKSNSENSHITGGYGGTLMNNDNQT